MRAVLASALLLLAVPAAATTYFNSMPYNIVNSPTVDPNSQNEVNGNFNQIISDGNNAIASINSALSGVSTAGMPSGGVIMWQALSCPLGYVTANGSNGTADLRGVFIRGLDNGAGVDPGRGLATYQGDMFQNHYHTYPTALLVSVSNVNHTNIQSGSDHTVLNNTTGSNSNNTSNMNGIGGQGETRPYTLVVQFCQKS